MSRPASLDLDAVLQDALDSIDRLPPDLTLVGNCSGAVLALLIMAQRPQAIRDHTITLHEASAAPHIPQKRERSGFSWPHAGQTCMRHTVKG